MTTPCLVVLLQRNGWKRIIFLEFCWIIKRQFVVSIQIVCSLKNNSHQIMAQEKCVMFYFLQLNSFSLTFSEFPSKVILQKWTCAFRSGFIAQLICCLLSLIITSKNSHKFLTLCIFICKLFQFWPSYSFSKILQLIHHIKCKGLLLYYKWYFMVVLD